MTLFDALVTFVGWTTVALGIGMLAGRIFRLPEDDPEPGDLAEVLHFDAERRRSRRDARNGIGGAA